MCRRARRRGGRSPLSADRRARPSAAEGPGVGVDPRGTLVLEVLDVPIRVGRRNGEVLKICWSTPNVISSVVGVLKFDASGWGDWRSLDRVYVVEAVEAADRDVDLVRLDAMISLGRPVVVVAARARQTVQLVREESELVRVPWRRNLAASVIVLCRGRTSRETPRLPVLVVERRSDVPSYDDGRKQVRIEPDSPARGRQVLAPLDVVANSGVDRQVARRQRVAERARVVLGLVDRAHASGDRARGSSTRSRRSDRPATPRPSR